jgi:hypothetical protein
MDEYLGYFASQLTNRQVFLLNFSSDARSFQILLSALRDTWARLGTERDTAGHSHAGLLVFANLVAAHTLIGFQQISSYQSFLAWMTFRPGLEALLMIGKFLDDPSNTGIWQNRDSDPKKYRETFWGRALESKSLPKSAVFRQVLGRLNDDFMHPNPSFTYRAATQTAQANSVLLETQLFDTDPDIHEAHVLAYINLVDHLVSVSEELINALCGPSAMQTVVRPVYADQERGRATQLATRTHAGKKIMEDLGLWSL